MFLINVFRLFRDTSKVCMITKVSTRFLNVLYHCVNCFQIRICVNRGQGRVTNATRTSVSIRRIFNLFRPLYDRASVFSTNVCGTLYLNRADLNILYKNVYRQLSASEVKTTRQGNPGVRFQDFPSKMIRWVRLFDLFWAHAWFLSILH